MGRPPHGGGPVFRFNQNEVLEMEACLQEINNAIPPREIICALADKFTASPERVGKIAVQPKQVWNWFQNRRYAQRAKLGKPPGKLSVLPMPRDEPVPLTNVAAPVPAPVPAPTGRTSADNTMVEFEAKSARDGACWTQLRYATLRKAEKFRIQEKAFSMAKKISSTTVFVEDSFVTARGILDSLKLLNKLVNEKAKKSRYDVSAFLSHRMFETSDPEVRVRFSGFGVEEDEWINVRRCVRQRSLPCEAAECVAVLPGDLILCFQEGKEQALYFDAHVLDVQRRRHDVRGCRCRFLVRYDHDQSEEIVPLRKVCRRPETDYRMQILQASKITGPGDLQATARDLIQTSSKDLSSQRTRKQRKLMDVNTDEVTTISLPHAKDSTGTQGDKPVAGVENSSSTPVEVVMEDAAVDTNRVEPQQEGNT